MREWPQLLLRPGDARVEQVDQLKRLHHRPPPDLRHPALLEQRGRVRAAQLPERDAQPPLGENAEDAVFGRGPQAHEVHPAGQPLVQLPLLERGNPDRRDEIPPGQLRQHPRVNLVRLRGQRRNRPHLAAVRHLHPPAAGLEPVTHPSRAAHHLQAGVHIRSEPRHQLHQPVDVRRHVPSATSSPSARFAHHAARRYAQSSPT
jgi:hypothetical protein